MPLHRLLAFFAALAVGATAAAQPLPAGITPELVDRARELLRSVPFADGHNDLPSSLLDVVRGDLDAPGADLNRVQLELPADIPRLREGGVGMQFWSAFVDTDFIRSGIRSGRRSARSTSSTGSWIAMRTSSSPAPRTTSSAPTPRGASRR